MLTERRENTSSTDVDSGTKRPKKLRRRHHNGEFDDSKAESSAPWIIDAPWAHLVWSRYLLSLYDLTTPAPRPRGWFSTCPAPRMNSSCKRWTRNGSSPRTRRSVEAATGRLIPPNTAVSS
ncbi:hypothetical protein CN171_23745 [Sinorhizobium meliloti]|nr:hypothetical protein CN171_23745 [Sinorhizobium meliloti]